MRLIAVVSAQQIECHVDCSAGLLVAFSGVCTRFLRPASLRPVQSTPTLAQCGHSMDAASMTMVGPGRPNTTRRKGFAHERYRHHSRNQHHSGGHRRLTQFPAGGRRRRTEGQTAWRTPRPDPRPRCPYLAKKSIGSDSINLIQGAITLPSTSMDQCITISQKRIDDREIANMLVMLHVLAQ